MAMSCVQDNHIDFGADQLSHALKIITSCADRGADA